MLLFALVGFSPLMRSRSGRLAAVKEVTLGLGCFWEPSEKLLEVDGVLATSCGYAGSAFEDNTPTYDSVCGGDGNVEAVQVKFDDNVISVEGVLDRAFEVAKPSLNSRQYNPVIFVGPEDDRERFDNWRQTSLSRGDGLQSTMFKLENASKFYRAEKYHQEYWQRWRLRAGCLGLLLLLQTFGPPLTQEVEALCTVVFYGILGVAVLERLVDKSVEEVPL